LLADVGVIEIVKPVISTKLVVVAAKLAVIKAFLTCTTPPAAKLKLALSDAAVKTSPAV
jgi:hypothetical protein